MLGAILGGAAISGGLGLLGSRKAGRAQKKAAKQSANVQQSMFDQSQEMQAPWQQTGASALAQLAGLYGLSPVNYMGGEGNAFPGGVPGQEAAMANFFTSPGYQFRMDEGMKALGGMASAQGQRGHGATSADIMRYGQGLASDEYNQYTNRLAALAGLGQTSSGQMGNQAFLTGRGIGDAYSQHGNARASGIMGVTNTLGNTINNAAWMYGMYGGGGGGGIEPGFSKSGPSTRGGSVYRGGP